MRKPDLRWLKCFLRGGHDMVHQGPGTWAAVCSRCGESYYLPKITME